MWSSSFLLHPLRSFQCVVAALWGRLGRTPGLEKKGSWQENWQAGMCSCRDKVPVSGGGWAAVSRCARFSSLSAGNLNKSPVPSSCLRSEYTISLKWGAKSTFVQHFLLFSSCNWLEGTLCNSGEYRTAGGEEDFESLPWKCWRNWVRLKRKVKDWGDFYLKNNKCIKKPAFISLQVLIYPSKGKSLSLRTMSLKC